MIPTEFVSRIAILGSGAWGTALALVAADAGHDVLMWAREDLVVREINQHHANPYLANVTLPDRITATTSMDACADCPVIVVAIPTQFIRPTLGPNIDILNGAILVDVSKGIEQGTHLRVSEILDDLGAKPSAYVVLSGPSHAEEVGRRIPTTVVAASSDARAADLVQDIFNTDVFRVYTSGDVVGVEICGAMKNVIAIAAGMIDGLGMGDNTKAALVTRGLAEIARFGCAMGAEKATFYGLAGLGDLVVTCDSKHSRNRFVGEQLGRGRALEEVLGNMSAVAEGVPTTKAVMEIASERAIELPISTKVYQIMFEGLDPRTALYELMTRPVRCE
ncbi:MAG: NAD(P)-dependent glycerol-3-phosphate dehydrogenase [Candidatus Kapabacteria bacterium]|nr:NAD(P)-dependent glycerol-3-phosphate dehydrogenase [Candidatus Kapabacteria bacterium]